MKKLITISLTLFLPLLAQSQPLRPRHPDGFLGLLQGDHRKGAVSESYGEDRG